MASSQPAEPASERVMSIDALRGFNMFWLIGGRDLALAIVPLVALLLPETIRDTVNEQVQWHLNHPEWEGFSAWDMIMPLFLFIVGAAMPFSFGRRQQEGQGLGAIYCKILFRVIALWVLGLAVQGNLLRNPAELHLFCNTLQAIAAGYLVAAIALLHLPVLAQVALTAVLLVGYALLMLLVPIPEIGAGLLEPKQNLALYVDELILGQFRDGTTYTWILSSMGFAATVLLGVHAGQIIRSQARPVLKTVCLTAAGAACLGLGWFWAGGFAEGTPVREWLGAWRLPIIKHLWTSSMALWAAGWCYLLLAGFHLVIDVIGFRRWSMFFVVIGMNAIFAYVAWNVVGGSHIANALVGGYGELLASRTEPWPLVAKLLHATVAFAVMWLILLYMYRKRTFLRV